MLSSPHAPAPRARGRRRRVIPPRGPEATGINQILVVCTGNICRSPLGELLLAALVQETGITVASAGTNAVEGSGVDAGMLPHVQALGLPSDTFVASQITHPDVEDSDLILTMTKRQREYIISEWPSALRKVVLLGQMPDLAAAQRHVSDSHPGAPELAINPEVIHHLVRDIDAHTAEIPDPFRQDPEVYAHSAQLVHDNIVLLAQAIFASLHHHLKESE